MPSKEIMKISPRLAHAAPTSMPSLGTVKFGDRDILSRQGVRHGLAERYLGRNRFFDSGPRLHALEIVRQGWPLRDADACGAKQQQSPGEVGIRDGEAVADEEFAIRKVRG